MLTIEASGAGAATGDRPTRLRRGVLVGALLVASLGWLGLAQPARAALVVAPTTLQLDLTPGATGIVRGDITNTTGVDLRSTDFLGSFSGFADGALIIDQLLGVTDLLIDDRVITRGLDLFSVQLGANAVAGASYFVEFFFGESVGGNFSESAVVRINVAGAQGVPAPSAAWLVAGGLLGLAAMRRRNPSPNPQEA